MHTIILPYFCDAEVHRYEYILAHLQRLGPQQVPFEFLLAASPRTKPSNRLMKAASAVAASRHFQCPSQVFGYPAGPSAMFWDCLEHLAEDSAGDGFALWMESDMCPVKADWLDRLDADWIASGDVLVMGCVVPQLHRHERRLPLVSSLLERPFSHRPWVPQHVNGGACYRRDLVAHMPAGFRDGLFDVRLGEILRDLGGYADTPAIRFSTLERLKADLEDPEKVLLHGYLQDKDAFLRGCIERRTPTPRASRRFSFGSKRHPAQSKLDAIFSVKDCLPPVLTVYQRRRAATQQTVQSSVTALRRPRRSGSSAANWLRKAG